MRILVGSDSPYIPSGFAQQLKGVAEHLALSGHEVSYLAWQTRGDFQIADMPFRIIGSSSPFGKNDWTRAFELTNPDIVISLGDAHMVDVLGRINRPIWFMYYPLDGDPISPLIGSVIKSSDVPIAMAHYGQQLTTSLGFKPHYIPHFYRSEDFFDLGEDAKTEIRQAMGLSPDTFIIGCLARLNPRKHHQRLLMAFKKFIDRHPEDDIKLYLHLDPHDPIMFQDPNHNYQFIELIDTMGLSNKVILTPQNNYHRGIPTEQLNQIINSWDVHVLPTGGEGFGVPFLEVAATGIPTIATDYTTTKEHLLLKDPYSGEVITEEEEMRGIAVPFSRLYMELAQVNKAWINIDALTDAFDKYYMDRDLLKKHGENAKAYVEKYYTYETIMAHWDELIKQVYTNIGIISFRGDL